MTAAEVVKAEVDGMVAHIDRWLMLKDLQHEEFSRWWAALPWYERAARTVRAKLLGAWAWLRWYGFWKWAG